VRLAVSEYFADFGHVIDGENEAPLNGLQHIGKMLEVSTFGGSAAAIMLRLLIGWST
jgi:hypothetical protein